jgi:hypothetical protein
MKKSITVRNAKEVSSNFTGTKRKGSMYATMKRQIKPIKKR